MKIHFLGATTIIAALAMAGCATSPGYGGSYNNGYSNAPTSSYGNNNNNNCYDCGTVTRIESVARGQNVPNATGAVLGGIVGAAAGHEISDHTGGSRGNKNLAAVAGAVGGAIAGNAIQNRTQESSTYNIYVRMNDGRTAMTTQTDLSGIREGSFVQIRNGRASLR
ncbi:MAG: peptidoglycan-associated outer membrane lipoprotein precursor [Luteimonas sp.]